MHMENNTGKPQCSISQQQQPTDKFAKPNFFSLEDILEAICVLHEFRPVAQGQRQTNAQPSATSSNSSKLRHKADLYLQQVQKAPETWNVLVQILNQSIAAMNPTGNTKFGVSDPKLDPDKTFKTDLALSSVVTIQINDSTIPWLRVVLFMLQEKALKGWHPKVIISHQELSLDTHGFEYDREIRQLTLCMHAELNLSQDYNDFLVKDMAIVVSRLLLMKHKYFLTDAIRLSPSFSSCTVRMTSFFEDFPLLFSSFHDSPYIQVDVIQFVTALHVLLVYPLELQNPRLSLHANVRRAVKDHSSHIFDQILYGIARWNTMLQQDDHNQAIFSFHKKHKDVAFDVSRQSLHGLIFQTLSAWAQTGPCFAIKIIFKFETLFQHITQSLLSITLYKDAMQVFDSLITALTEHIHPSESSERRGKFNCEASPIMDQSQNVLVAITHTWKVLLHHTKRTLKMSSEQENCLTYQQQQDVILRFSSTTSACLPFIIHSLPAENEYQDLEQAFQVFLHTLQHSPINVAFAVLNPLQIYFVSISGHFSTSITTTNDDNNIQSMIRNHFHLMIQTLLHRSSYSASFFALSLANQEDWYRFRQELRTLLRSLVNDRYPHYSSMMFQFLTQAFEYQIQHIRIRFENFNPGRAPPADHESEDNDLWWTDIESLLHSLSAVAKAIPENETGLLAGLFGFLVTIPNPPPISCSIALLISVSIYWLRANTHYLSHAMKLISNALTHNELGDSHGHFVMRSMQDHVGVVAIHKLVLICPNLLVDKPWLYSVSRFYFENFKVNPLRVLENGSHKLLIQSIADLCVRNRTPLFHQLSHDLTIEMINRLGLFFSVSSPTDDNIILLLQHSQIVFSIPFDSLNDEKRNMLKRHWDFLMKALVSVQTKNRSIFKTWCEWFIVMISPYSQHMDSLIHDLSSIVIKVYGEILSPDCISLVIHIAKILPDHDEYTGKKYSLISQIFDMTCSTLNKPQLSRVIMSQAIPGLVALIDMFCNLASSELASLLFETPLLKRSCALVDSLIRTAWNEDLTRACCKFYSQFASIYSHIASLEDSKRSLRQSCVLDAIFQAYVHDGQGVTSLECLLSSKQSEQGAISRVVVDAIHCLWLSFGTQNFSRWLMTVCEKEPSVVGKKISKNAQNRERFIQTLLRPECWISRRKFGRVLESGVG